MKKDQISLMNSVQLADFGMIETNLFLDTHPYDREAMAAFEKYRRASDEARENYERKCGPLRADTALMSGTWRWVSDPWPWELED